MSGAIKLLQKNRAQQDDVITSARPQKIHVGTFPSAAIFQLFSLVYVMKMLLFPPRYFYWPTNCLTHKPCLNSEIQHIN